MTQIAQGAHAYIFPEPGQVYRVQADDVATVQIIYGAPSALITLTAQSQTFGPYDSPAKLKVSANTAACEYTLIRAHYAELTQQQLDSGAVGVLASDNAGGAIEPDGDVPSLGGTESSVTVVNDLTTGGMTAALSAEMGKTLQTSKLGANADAIADVLEAAATGAPADLARIKASVSGAVYCRTAFNSVPQLVVAANSENACYAQCHMVPGRYDAVRIGFVHAGGSGNVTGMAAACAATDDIGDRSNANTVAGRKFVSPLRGGVEKNAYQADGWQRLTVGGAVSWDIAGGSTVNDVAVAWTDICEVHGIESAQYPGYYPLLLRVYPGATFTRPGITGFADPTKYLAEVGSKFMLGCYRITSGGGGVPNDAVSVIGNWTQASNVNFADAAVLAVIIEAYVGGVRHKTIIMSGDSRFHAAPPSLEATNSYRHTSTAVDTALVASGKKGIVLRAGQGARTTAQYFARLDKFTEQVKPDYVAHVCYSINNGVPLAATADALFATARYYTLRVLDKCAAIKATPILVPIYPYSTGYEAGAARTAAFAFNEWCKGLGVTYVDMLSQYGDAAGGWLAGTNEDANHGTWTTYQAQAALIAAKIV